MEISPQNISNIFLKDKHIKFCVRSLFILPQRCQPLDSLRLVIAFFVISTLDVLDALSRIDDEKSKIIEWIYSFQVLPDSSNVEPDLVDCGFRGSNTCTVKCTKKYDLCDKAHIAMTYTALSTLLILGDDLSRVDKKSIIKSLRKLQLPDGSFRAMNIESENDMRFVYCAACICYILQDWSGMDVKKTVQYIKNSVNYDGGIGQGPGLESHGGSTFCGIAALYLMGELGNAFSSQKLKALKRWLVFRQQKGFQGRPNKPEDTCYTFWIGATLKLLNCYNFVNYPEVLNFVLLTQDEVTGGIAKWIDYGPDFLHTYLAISGLALNDFKDIPCSIHPALNISVKASNHLAQLHSQWKMES